MHGAPGCNSFKAAVLVAEVEAHELVGKGDRLPPVRVSKSLLDHVGVKEDGVDLAVVLHRHDWAQVGFVPRKPRGGTVEGGHVLEPVLAHGVHARSQNLAVLLGSFKGEWHSLVDRVGVDHHTVAQQALI